MNWEDRVHRATGDPHVSHFVNNHDIGLDTTFGNLCAFTDNQMQAVIATGQQGRHEVDVNDLPPRQGENFLHGMAFWLLVGDHCYVVQHSSVRTRAIESYLSWLLRQTGTLTDSEQVVLQAEFATGDVSGVGEVTAIEVGGLVPETIDPPESGDEQRTVVRDVDVRRTLEERVAGSELASRCLNAAFGTLEADRIMGRVPEGAALKVTVQVGYVTTRREVSREALASVAVAARNLDDGEVLVKGRNGNLRGEDARLHMPVRLGLVHPNGNLFDWVDVQEKLLSVHDRFLEEGRIPPD
ncbi:MAG: hypothetical protein OXP36_12615 [Gammaproteobacteria bacterium]|nr:hypothetical protein [Gammaproteobacteria bacterium]